MKSGLDAIPLFLLDNLLRILRIFITGGATALTIMLLFCSIRNILCNVLQFIEVQF